MSIIRRILIGFLKGPSPSSYVLTFFMGCHHPPKPVSHYMALEEVHPETLDYLRPLLRKTLDTGETVQLPHTAWYLHAQTRDGGLYVSLWWGIADSTPPLTMQVEQSDPPRCTVSITDSADLDNSPQPRPESWNGR